MASIRTLSVATLIALLAAVHGGCSGEDGSEGVGGDGPTPVATTPAGSAPSAAPPAATGDPDERAVETCVSCHGEGTLVPVGDIGSAIDAHAVDRDPDGPLTSSGIRRLDATVDRVDVRGASVVLEFTVADEAGAPVDVLFDSDGRFTIARLEPGTNGDPSEWVAIGDGLAESFTAGLFESLSSGSYRYTSLYDPRGRIAEGDAIRVAIQLSASDLPAENAWCDFDADLLIANVCGSGASLSRDIVQTTDCNVCHGPTPETRLSFHGGGRVDVEYCVTCHNPTGATDMTPLVHKIHAGEYLTNGFSSYSEVAFPKDLDACAACHTGAGAEVDSWKTVPHRTACGSCHDEVNFDTGQNHGSGGVQRTNALCSGCHPAEGAITGVRLPVATVHPGMSRAAEAARYRGPGSGYFLEQLDYDEALDEIRVVYSVGRDGSPMDLSTAPEWTAGGRLSLRVGWNTDEYSNEGSGAVPAQPFRVDALDLGGTVTALPGTRYEALIARPARATGTLTVHLEGRPVADLLGDGSFDDRIPVESVVGELSVDGGRATPHPRREIVDAALCAVCHDSGGAGLAFHGTQRVGEVAVCAVCHNPDATDIGRRPADPAQTPDGKREEAIDLKRMIHQIHAGGDLETPPVFYGFGGTPNDYDHVEFLGHLANCETCHLPGSYSTEAAGATAATSVETDPDLADPSDDRNISPIASVCSSCHDDAIATKHMVRYGAAFRVLDEDIQ